MTEKVAMILSNYYSKILQIKRDLIIEQIPPPGEKDLKTLQAISTLAYFLTTSRIESISLALTRASKMSLSLIITELTSSVSGLI